MEKLLSAFKKYMTIENYVHRTLSTATAHTLWSVFLSRQHWPSEMANTARFSLNRSTSCLSPVRSLNFFLWWDIKNQRFIMSCLVSLAHRGHLQRSYTQRIWPEFQVRNSGADTSVRRTEGRSFAGHAVQDGGSEPRAGTLGPDLRPGGWAPQLLSSVRTPPLPHWLITP